MAYCLRELPQGAQALIDEMCQYWRDLEQLKAAGGTPLVRCLKGFEITPSEDVVWVKVSDDYLGHIRAFGGFRRHTPKYKCQRCRVGGAVRGCWPCLKGIPVYTMTRSIGFSRDRDEVGCERTLACWARW